MKVAIAISSVLGLCIASPANAHIELSGANGGISTNSPSARSEDRPHDGEVSRPGKREVVKFEFRGAVAISKKSLVVAKAGGVLGDTDSVTPGRPDAEERGDDSRRDGLGVPRAAHLEGSHREFAVHAATNGGLAVAKGAGVLEMGPAADKSFSDEPVRGQGSGVAFDLGPNLVGGVEYGEGVAGAAGVPGFSYLGEVSPGATITLFVENSSNVEAIGYLRVGSKETHVVLRSGAALLCSIDVYFDRIRLDPGTNEIEFTIPADAEKAIYMQVIEQDEMAFGGWSMTKGLKLLL